MFGRRFILSGALGALLALQGSVAVAAPGPANDKISGATVISAIPFSETLNTTKATTDADDDAVNANCGAPATDASVWYTLAGTGGMLLVDVSASDYSAGVIVASGSPGSLSVVACGPGSVAFEAATGESYYLLAFDDQFDGGGNGGQLSIAVDVAPPPPEISLTVNGAGRFNPSTGVATISGTITCTGQADWGEVYGDLTQQVGRFTIRGWFYTSFTCDGSTQPWSAEVYPDNGKFGGGKASASVFAFACNVSGCGESSVQKTVTLRK